MSPDIDILRPHTDILRPDIDILRPDIVILSPDIDILRPDTDILRPDIDILRPKISRSIIMYKHYYAQGPPAYPDIHILRPDNDILRQHLSCKVFIYFRIPYIRTQIISTGGKIYLEHIEGIYTSIFLMFIIVNICTRASCVDIWLLMATDKCYIYNFFPDYIFKKSTFLLGEQLT